MGETVVGDGVVEQGSGDVVFVVLMVVIAAVLILIVGRRPYRYFSLRSLARGRKWQWLGNSTSFVRFVVSVFPELVEETKRSARRSSMSARRRSLRNASSGDVRRRQRQAARLALDVSGVNGRGRVGGKGRYVVVADGAIGELNIGEAQVIARARGRRRVRRASEGNRSDGASVHVSAAVARLPAGLPTVRLAPRIGWGRWIRSNGDDGLPQEVGRRFDTSKLDAEGRAAVIDSGAYRALFESRVRVHGLVLAKGGVVVVTRRRLTRRRARALAEVTEQVVQRIPADAWKEPVGAVTLRTAVSE